jgi:hypothetical protein
MYDLTLNHTLSHANRSFDIDTPVDADTVQCLSNMIDEFLNQDAIAYKTIIRDTEIIKKLYYVGIWNRDGEYNGEYKLPSLWAPLIIVLPPVDRSNGKLLINLGRFYAKLGMEVLKRGYALAYQNSLDYHDPRVRELQQYLHIDYDSFVSTKNDDDFPVRTFICIGKKLIPNSAHNWDWTRAELFESCSKLDVDFVKDLT